MPSPFAKKWALLDEHGRTNCARSYCNVLIFRMQLLLHFMILQQQLLSKGCLWCMFWAIAPHLWFAHIFNLKKKIYSRTRAFIWYIELSCTPCGYWVILDRKERKKEERTKLKFSCLCFSAFVWASRTLGTCFLNGIAKPFCFISCG